MFPYWPDIPPGQEEQFQDGLRSGLFFGLLVALAIGGILLAIGVFE